MKLRRLLASLACVAWGAHKWAPYGPAFDPPIRLEYEHCTRCRATRVTIDPPLKKTGP